MRNLGLSRPCCLLSTGASPPVCLLYAGWLSHHLLLHASASCHLLLHRQHMRPSSSSSSPLCSRQLVVALHLFSLPLPLDTPPSYDWLSRHRRRRCAGIVAVNAQASSPSSRLQLSPSLHIIKMALSHSLLLSTTSIAIVVVVVSHRAVAIVIVVIACHAATIIVDFVAHRCERPWYWWD